ncbi:MAG: M20 family metallopeptidase [Candidatus Limnocylindrales bacterium]
MTDTKARLAAAVAANRDEILAVSHAIHADPEIAFQEIHASTLVAATVARHGFTVERPAGSLATAVRGRLAGGLGMDGPRIGILAEYDALPGLGHGCGHNSMAASGVGAAIALSAIAPDLRGEIVFLGTPAEEAGSGKAIMIEDGLFDGLDAALLYHPCDRTHTEINALACSDLEVVYTGLQAHASASPWLGKNALDALILLFSSVGLWRQQLRPDARVHGIIVEGGTASNIIPGRTVARFMVRSEDQARFEGMEVRFRELVQAAALATGCAAQVTVSSSCSTMRHNTTIGAAFRANLGAAGMVDQGPDAFNGSTDMGNVSHVVPTIHPELAIVDEGTASHSTEFRDAAGGPRGDATTLMAATLIAQTAYDLFAEPGLVEAAWREFRGD